jgi:hypothetical protein
MFRATQPLVPMLVTMPTRNGVAGVTGSLSPLHDIAIAATMNARSSSWASELPFFNLMIVDII